MKKTLYEVIFAVTETTQNGNERRIQKAVFMPFLDKYGKPLTVEYRIERGTEALRAEHFYNIEYVKTVRRTLIFPQSY